MADFAHARDRMVAAQLKRRGIADPHVLAAMAQVPREEFVAPGYGEFAYEDSALPIAEGRTISQPFIVAAMIEAAAIAPDDKVLEVGSGSGYAAAVLSRIAGRVFAIERHASLTEAAAARFVRLGYDNIQLRTGDGTKGWPEEAPFDAIIVSAGGPRMPAALKQQLRIGGVLILPVGAEGEQRLLRLVRTGEDDFEQDDLGAMRFVRLIGQEGWKETEAPPAPSLPGLIAQCAEPLPDFDDEKFGALFDRFGARRVVLLGEASHGTSEFYRARAAITKRLITEHGFTIVAVEADWPDAASLNRYVRGLPEPKDAPAPFQRFPAWMWKNRDVADFIQWLKAHNARAAAPVGFYGLDIYNMQGSVAAVLAYLDRVDPQAAGIARQRYGCLTPWQHDPAAYGRAVLSEGYEKCEKAVVRQCRELLEKEFAYASDHGDDFLDAAQNARLVAAAERYYRVMYYGAAESWNLRDTHMFETLEHLLDWRGADAKAVVWAHNSHIGDARQTDMGRFRDEINIGQLCRERFGRDAALIGMGTASGTVAAASDWDGPAEIKQVRPARAESFERLCHESETSPFLLDFSRHPELSHRLAEERLERFIGVIYRPETELQSHYAEAALSRQFDAWLWFDRSHAVQQLSSGDTGPGVPDTFPFGV